MTRQLDPKAAAAEIRHEILDRPDITPEARHMMAFAEQVCRELGITPDPVNCMAVASALHDAAIRPYHVQEYPKMLVDDNSKAVCDEAGAPIIFNSADEEADYNSGVRGGAADDSSHTLTDEELAVRAAQQKSDEEAKERQAAEEQKAAEAKADAQRKAEREREKGTTGNQTPKKHDPT